MEFYLNLYSKRSFMKKESDNIHDEREEDFKIQPVKVDYTMTDHSNDPYFVKKLEDAKKTLEKVKFPPDWRTKK
jgi:hypothetical protein